MSTLGDAKATALSLLVGKGTANSMEKAFWDMVAAGGLDQKPPGTTVQGIRALVDATGILTWTFPKAYPVGAMPIIQVTVEDNTASAIWSAKTYGLSNTGVTIQLSKSATVTVAGIQVLGIVATTATYINVYVMTP